MPSFACRRIPVVALCGWLAAGTVVAGEPHPVAPIDFSVLTPAMEGRFVVVTGFDFTAMVPPYLALSQMGSRARTERLRALVAREGYDPVRAIADRLIEQLPGASYSAVHEPIGRRPPGSIQSLAWGDLPERLQGELALDVTIRWICLCNSLAYSKYYPGIALSWRLLDPAREVVQPTRNITYVHDPFYHHKKKAGPSASVSKPRESEYPLEQVSEICGFASIEAAEKNPEVLWGCFGEAYDAALRRLVIDLKKLRPPRAVESLITRSTGGN